MLNNTLSDFDDFLVKAVSASLISFGIGIVAGNLLARKILPIYLSRNLSWTTNEDIAEKINNLGILFRTMNCFTLAMGLGSWGIANNYPSLMRSPAILASAFMFTAGVFDGIRSVANSIEISVLATRSAAAIRTRTRIEPEQLRNLPRKSGKNIAATAA